MGFSNSQITFYCMICTFLFLLRTPSSSALISSSSSTSASPKPHEIQPQTPTAAIPTAAAVFYIKNTPPFEMDKQEPIKKNRKMRHKRNMNKKRKKTTTKKDFKTAPFSVMLPKGFVPPSGSSPCHNAYPNSVAFFCDLAPTAAKP
ncbi:hypothetical protein D8674_027731 [Pyrus ussuriensis x Pyrus communis]|uniref:Uncharacterized protein n=1 Tax=Pyrus ussuriensis x Pyrus communis TaxID=2448454 RepID=A0A5N5ID33_9ROSA|nr:uncharacterized protein LOC125476450 [Pyrus x bretschneideri]KAB2637197.1 hypothetical protein D8674_027731 [Pyrus ussuriensis x Pyrus communis]